MADSTVSTVCAEALCPNKNECWSRGHVTFQILGKVCSRHCAFCAETSGAPATPDPSEPEKLADLALRLRLKHIVITSPSRDDLPDLGIGHYIRCLTTLREKAPGLTVEMLIPDFQGKDDLLDLLCQARPDVLNHNLETVQRLTPTIRSAQASYPRSLAVLKRASDRGLRTKSGIMVGLGETIVEVFQTLADIREQGVAWMTVGQYLPPSATHAPLSRYYSPDEFATIRRRALEIGFEKVMAQPYVRSSYQAGSFADGKEMPLS